MRSATSYDTKLNPHGPSLSGYAWLCHQSVLLPAPFFSCPTSQLRCAITFFALHKSPTKLLGFGYSSSSHQILSVGGLRSTGDLVSAEKSLGEALLAVLQVPTEGG